MHVKKKRKYLGNAAYLQCLEKSIPLSLHLIPTALLLTILIKRVWDSFNARVRNGQLFQ